MTDSDNSDKTPAEKKPSARAQDRADKRAAALRENLMRRKAKQKELKNTDNKTNKDGE